MAQTIVTRCEIISVSTKKRAFRTCLGQYDAAMYRVAGVFKAARTACFELILGFMDSRMMNRVLDTLFQTEHPLVYLADSSPIFSPHRPPSTSASCSQATDMMLPFAEKSRQ
jgi:hypothetical protein